MLISPAWYTCFPRSCSICNIVLKCRFWIRLSSSPVENKTPVVCHKFKNKPHLFAFMILDPAICNGPVAELWLRPSTVGTRLLALSFECLITAVGNGAGLPFGCLSGKNHFAPPRSLLRILEPGFLNSVICQWMNCLCMLGVQPVCSDGRPLSSYRDLVHSRASSRFFLNGGLIS